MESEAQPTSATSEVSLDDLDPGPGELDEDLEDRDALGAPSASASPSAVTTREGESALLARPALPVGLPAKEPLRPASIPFLVVLTGISLAADLVSKHYAKSRLSGFDLKTHSMHRVEIWKGHVDFIFAQNPGGAWSFLRGLPDTLRRPFFLAVSAAAIVFIISIYRRIGADQKAMKWGLPLALGGAMGNLVDRMRYGWVVDFVDVYVSRRGREHHWPTFNVADIAIVIGVGLMAIDMLWIRRAKPRSPDLTPHPSSP